jgi:uncharacterized membrane-anchored protein YhcB (DUF1043 family)
MTDTTGKTWGETVTAHFEVEDARAALLQVETLRDHFAGQALTGLCAKPEFQATYRHYAECSYKLADAMLEARKFPEAENLVTNGDFSNGSDGWSTDTPKPEQTEDTE